MKVSRFVSLFFGLGLAVSANAAPDPNFHIYLAFGQSNMEGQANIESQDKTVDKRFQVLWTTNETNCGKKLGKWSDAVPPLASCSSKLGPADYFGRTMVEKTDSQIRVGIVDVAVAGCSIQLFDSPISQSYMNQQAGWFKQRVEAYGGKPYERLIEMAKKAQEDGVIKVSSSTRAKRMRAMASGPLKSKRFTITLLRIWVLAMMCRSLRAKCCAAALARARTTISLNSRNSLKTFM